LDAFDQRIQGDYQLGITITADETQILIIQASEFLQEALHYLE
jgi:uncharacterized protein (UPF0332 family)